MEWLIEPRLSGLGATLMALSLWMSGPRTWGRAAWALAFVVGCTLLVVGLRDELLDDLARAIVILNSERV